MEPKKEFSIEKLNAFLNKVDKKLEKNEEVGDENKNVLKSWITELNNSKEKTLKVEVNKELYEKNLNEQKETFDKMLNIQNAPNIENNNDNNAEGLTKENFEQKFKEKIDVLLKEETSIPKKEEIITLIDKYYLTHLNIKNKIFSSEIEEILISLLDKCEKDEEKVVQSISGDNKNVLPYSNSIMISLTLMSILTKRIITLKVVCPDFNEEFPVMKKYFEIFLKIFPLLIKYNDFRIRSGILNSIANLTSYMLMNKMEEELLNLLEMCTKDIFLCIKSTSMNLKNKITSDFQKMEAPYKESIDLIANNTNSNIINNTGHFSLDFSKTILIEMINRLPLDENQFEKIQNLINISKKILNIICQLYYPDVLSTLLLLLLEFVSGLLIYYCQ